jgi:hypothetical protein
MNQNNIMQVKPRFEYFKILEQYFILKDDTNNDMCLTLFEVKLPDSTTEIIESSYKFWAIVGKTQVSWGNKSSDKTPISYDNNAYWRSKERKNLFKGEINGFLIEEEIRGFHNMFLTKFPPDEKEFGLKTAFIFKKLK